MHRLVFDFDCVFHNIKNPCDLNQYFLTCSSDIKQRVRICLLYSREILNERMFQQCESFFKEISEIVLSNDKFDSRFEIISNYTLNVFLAEHPKPNNCDVTIIDNFMLIAYLSQKFNKKSNHAPLTSINHNNRYLCKFGKINRSHRYLLYCIMRGNNLFQDHLGDWSLYTHSKYKTLLEEEKESLKNIILSAPDYSLEDVSEHHRLLPDLVSQDTENESHTFHYTGYPFSMNPYQETKFSIVSETEFTASSLMFTEKFWIPTSIKHPVLLSASPIHAEVLLDLGFKSADNYEFCNASTLNDYQAVSDLFKKCYDKFVNTPAPELYEIANHNYELFQKISPKYLKKVSIPETSTFVKNNVLEPPSSSLLHTLLSYQYDNLSTKPYDWDLDGLDKFSSDK